MSFGATTDHFNIADTNWHLLTSGKSPVSSAANAQDSTGDNVCETVFDTAFSYTATYAPCGTGDTSGNVEWPTLYLGNDTTSAILRTGYSVATSNTARPVLTVNGETAFGTSNATYTLAPPTISIGKVASAMGFVPDTATVTRVTGSTWGITGQTAYVQDSQGQRCQSDVYGARVEASGELVSCTATATAIADTTNGYAVTGPVGNAETNTGYGTGSVAVYKNITADT